MAASPDAAVAVALAVAAADFEEAANSAANTTSPAIAEALTDLAVVIVAAVDLEEAANDAADETCPEIIEARLTCSPETSSGSARGKARHWVMKKKVRLLTSRGIETMIPAPQVR